MRVLLDLCVLSELNREGGSENVRQAVSELTDETIYLSVVTMGEIARGVAYKSLVGGIFDRVQRPAKSSNQQSKDILIDAVQGLLGQIKQSNASRQRHAIQQKLEYADRRCRIILVISGFATIIEVSAFIRHDGVDDLSQRIAQRPHGLRP